MTEKLEVLKNISTQLINDPPVFMITATQNFIDLFLLALLIFLCVLLLQISVNLVFHKGKNLPKQGFCCIVLALVLVAVFAPTPFLVPNLKDIESVKLITYENGQEIAKKSLQYYDKKSVFNVLASTYISRSLFDLPGVETQTGTEYKIVITSTSKKETQFLVNENSMYFSNLPDNGNIFRIVSGNQNVYSLLNDNKI